MRGTVSKHSYLFFDYTTYYTYKMNKISVTLPFFGKQNRQAPPRSEAAYKNSLLAFLLSFFDAD